MKFTLSSAHVALSIIFVNFYVYVFSTLVRRKLWTREQLQRIVTSSSWNLPYFYYTELSSTLLVHTRHYELEQSMASCISQPPSFGLVHKKDVPFFFFSESLKWNPPGGNKKVTPLAFPASSVTCSPKPNRHCTPNVKNKTLFPFLLLLLLVVVVVCVCVCVCVPSILKLKQFVT